MKRQSIRDGRYRYSWKKIPRLGADSVYFLQCDATKRIKIGFTTNIVGRMGKLNTASSSNLILRLLIPGGKDVEKDLQKHFAKYRCKDKREWFENNEELEQFILSCFTSRIKSFDYHERVADSDIDEYVIVIEGPYKGLVGIFDDFCEEEEELDNCLIYALNLPNPYEQIFSIPLSEIRPLKDVVEYEGDDTGIDRQAQIHEQQQKIANGWRFSTVEELAKTRKV